MGEGGATEGSGTVTMEYFIIYIFSDMVRNAIYKWICDDKQSKFSPVNKCLGNLQFIMAVILLSAYNGFDYQ